MRLRVPRLSPTTYRRITLVAAILLGVIIVTGGAVRLTGSGLGCPDWPNCAPGRLTPRSATDGHAMVEFVNRMFTGLVALSIAVGVLGSLRLVPRRRDLVWLSLGLVAGFIGQAVLGGLTVIFKLQPEFVMAHFLLSIVLLTNAIYLYHRAGQPDAPDARSRSLVTDHVRIAARWLIVTAAIVVVLGTVVTATGPHGGDRKAKRFHFDLPEVARLHGSFVIALLVIVAVTFWLLWRSRAPRALSRRLAVLLALLVVQAAIGYIQYFNGIPELLVGFHIAGATAVWSAVVAYVLGLSTREARAGDARDVPPAPALATSSSAP